MTKFQILSKAGHVLGTALYCSILYFFLDVNSVASALWGWFFFTVAVEGEQLSTAYFAWIEDGGPLTFINWQQVKRQSMADAFFWNGTLGLGLFFLLVSL